MESLFAKWVVRHRWLIITISVLIVACSASGIRHLHFTNDYRIYFSKDNPELREFETLENTYTKNDNVLIVVAPHDGTVFTRDTLSVIEEITGRAWQIPYSSRVDSITNFQYTHAEGDDLIVRNLVESAHSLSDGEIENIRNIAISEPLLLNRLVSANGHVTGINITLQSPDVIDAKETPEVVAYVRRIAEEVRSQHPEIRIYLTGFVFLNNAFLESAKHDLKTLFPVSFVLMSLLMIVLTGSLAGTLSVILIIACSVITAMGIGGHLGIPMSTPSASAPTVIMTVAMANCIHILMTFLYGLRHGATRLESIVESLRVNIQPVFIACFTTCVGFLTMNFSDVPPFRDLGNFAVIGLITSFVLSMSLLPSLLSVFPAHAKYFIDEDDSIMVRAGEYVFRYRNRLLWLILVLVMLMVSGIPRNQLNDIFMYYFDKSTEFRQDTDFTTANLTGANTIEYSLQSGEPGGISNPAFLHDADSFAGWLKQQPEVIHVSTITDIFKRLNKNMHGDRHDEYHLPADRELAAQYLLMYEMSLPYGLDLNNRINIDKSSTRLTATIKTLPSTRLLALDQRAARWLEDNATHILPVNGTGSGVMFANISSRNIKSMLISACVALVFISIVLICAFRSLKYGVISILPNLIPAAMGFGLWGYFEGEVGVALSIVATMTLGIIVDDTVHFLSKYLRARREHNHSAGDAVRYAFKTVGRALLSTSIILVCGFMVLATSSFKLNSDMGILVAIVILCALIADFLLLPSLLIKFEEKTNAKILTDDSAADSATV